MPARFKVVVYGGMDGLDFPDLTVNFSNGYAMPLKIKQGQYVPVEILDPLDVKKSLIVGSLGRYVASGAVIMEDDAIEMSPQPQSRFVPPDHPVTSETVSFVQEPTKPTITQSDLQKVEVAVAPQMTTLSEVKTVDDFFKLTYFLKLRFIKECKDKFVLEELLKRTVKEKQLQNNIMVRLSQI